MEGIELLILEDSGDDCVFMSLLRVRKQRGMQRGQPPRILKTLRVLQKQPRVMSPSVVQLPRVPAHPHALPMHDSASRRFYASSQIGCVDSNCPWDTMRGM
jgi:hypothetical protein